MLHGGKPAGEIKCDMHYFAVSAEEKQEDGTVVPAAESGTFIHEQQNPKLNFGSCL